MKNFLRAGIAPLVLIFVVAGLLVIGGGALYMAKKQAPQRQQVIGATNGNLCNMYKDESGIYQMVAKCGGCEPIERKDRPELDAESFRIVDENYSLDKNHVYYLCTAEEILSEADPNTFQVYENGTRLARDKERVYYNNFLVKGADPDTFVKLTSSFSKDKNSVYYTSNKVDRADPQTFKPLKYNVGIDKSNIYESGAYRKVRKIDSDSFVQIDDNSWKDKDYYYCYDNTSIHKSAKPCAQTDWLYGDPNEIMN